MTILLILENLSFLVLMSVFYQYLYNRYEFRSWVSQALSGLIFGLVGLMSIADPVRVSPGLIYDGRTVILGIAGAFGGPVTAAVAAAVCLIYRISIGGPGALVGSLCIVEAALLGALFHVQVQRGAIKVSIRSLAVLGILIHALMFALQFLLPDGIWREVVPGLALPVLVIYPIIFAIIGRVFLDSIERKKEHAALEESEARYKQMFTGNLAPMLLMDPADGSFIDANAAAEAFYGWKIDTLKTMNVFQLNTLPRKELGDLLSKASKSEQNHFHVKHRTAGGVREVEVFSSAVSFGERTLLHAIIFDVSNREAALRERDLLYQAIDSSFNEVYIFDADTLRFTYASRGALANLGYSMSQFARMTPLDIKRNLPKEEFAGYLDVLRSGKAPLVVFSVRHFRADGTSYPAEIRLSLHKDNDKKVFLAIASDMSEYRKAQDEIQEQVKELERWRNVTLDREERIIELKREVNAICDLAKIPKRYAGDYGEEKGSSKK